MTGLSTRWTAAAVVGLTLVASLSGGLLGARLASGEDGPQAVAAVADGAGCDVAGVAATVLPSLMTITGPAT